jgi:hypothetical protein
MTFGRGDEIRIDVPWLALHFIFMRDET